jgi:hypothetical protein
MDLGGADEQSEGGHEFGRIVERGHHLKLLDASGQGMLACLDIDFVQRLDVFGDEGDGDDQQMPLAFPRQAGPVGCTSLLQGLLEASDFVLQARNAARHREVIDEKDGPHGQISGHQAIEIFHFASMTWLGRKKREPSLVLWPTYRQHHPERPWWLTAANPGDTGPWRSDSRRRHSTS